MFFPRMGTGSMLCECVLAVCVFDSTSLRTACLKHDVPFLMSSDHMKHPSPSDLLAVLLVSSLLFFLLTLLPYEGADAWGRAHSPTLNQHWTSKGRHQLAHIWGQNHSHLSSHCEDEEGGLMNICCIVRRTCWRHALWLK